MVPHGDDSVDKLATANDELFIRRYYHKCIDDHSSNLTLRHALQEVRPMNVGFVVWAATDCGKIKGRCLDVCQVKKKLNSVKPPEADKVACVHAQKVKLKKLNPRCRRSYVGRGNHVYTYMSSVTEHERAVESYSNGYDRDDPFSSEPFHHPRLDALSY